MTSLRRICSSALIALTFALIPTAAQAADGVILDDPGDAATKEYAIPAQDVRMRAAGKDGDATSPSASPEESEALIFGEGIGPEPKAATRGSGAGGLASGDKAPRSGGNAEGGRTADAAGGSSGARSGPTGSRAERPSTVSPRREDLDATATVSGFGGSIGFAVAVLVLGGALTVLLRFRPREG